jgi:hypothetical protein
VLSSPPIPTLGGGSPSCIVNTQQTVPRCYRPCRHHGRCHQPRAPNLSCDAALPSSLPFNMSSSSSTNSKGRFLDFFRDVDKPVPPRKRSRRHHRSRRTGRRHGPRAPDLQEHLLSGRRRRHLPRLPNQSTCHGWE